MFLARFWNNRHGSVAPMAALSMFTLATAVGAAIDYSRANAARTAFQTALDSTALMLSKNAAIESRADLQTAVLDNTGSIADDGKMDALKTATKNLLTQLKAAATTDGDV